MKLRNKKTGQIGVLEATTYHGGRPDNIIEVYEVGMGAVYVLAQYSTLEGLLEEWEDYKDDEPLIKDSKACKIIRDWFNYNDNTLPLYCEDACALSINHGARIEFQKRVFGNLKKEYRYTINELCGEEEE